MKYGIVNKGEWEQNEAFPDGSFCIIFLDNTGHPAQNTLVHDIIVGDGSVWIIREGGRRERLGYFPLPMDIVFFGMFDTEQEAVDYYEDHYYNDTIQLEQSINEQIASNADIDDYVDFSIEARRNMRYYWIILACIVTVILVLMLIYLKRTGFHI